ncbi:uncharacterized protein BDV14DRAFT_197548 [Aspergillus stella-maris]|uniref:uncharacterized protein n=1 Tax=Aspergillus stella-maris TaxID=1810926 RepID=UPI003CCCE5FE
MTSGFKTLLLLASFALMALAAPASTEISIDAHINQELETGNFPEPTWKVQVHPDGPLLTLTGTIEKVHAQLREINPNYDEDWKDVPESDDFADFSPSTELHVLKSYNGPKALSCSKALESTANRKRIGEGIDYLRKHKGQVTVTTYPTYRCSRVSCSYKSAIVWCNESKVDLTLGSTKPIADAAFYVLNNCNHPNKDQVKGHVVYPGAWRTILQGADC